MQRKPLNGYLFKKIIYKKKPKKKPHCMILIILHFCNTKSAKLQHLVIYNNCNMLYL